MAAGQENSDAVLARTAGRYRSAARFTRHYVAGKLKRDPAGPALLRFAAENNLGDVADLGCGRGQFAIALLEAGFARSVIGVDCRAAHLAEAKNAGNGFAFTAHLQDFTVSQEVPAADTVLLVDVLYQLDTAAQSALLRNAAVAARRFVIVRSADPKRGLRSLMTRAMEITFRRVWPHAGARVNARPLGDLQAILEGAGLACERLPCWAGTPFSNMLLIGRHCPGKVG